MNIFGLKKLFAPYENKIKLKIVDAHNGLQALQVFRDHYKQGILFDLIFMDVNMPLMGVTLYHLFCFIL
jgi:CheY-like chemotaxis protein